MLRVSNRYGDSIEEQHKPEGAVPQIYIDGRLVGGYSDLVDESTPDGIHILTRDNNNTNETNRRKNILQTIQLSVGIRVLET